jgi:hypothetical protein
MTQKYFYSGIIVCDFMHTRLFLILFWVYSCPGFAQTFVKSYNKGDYEACIKQCQKEIDKKGDMKMAYLYKAKAWNQQIAETENCTECVRKALSSIESLGYKDRDSSFRMQHAADLDTIYTGAIRMIRYFIEAGNEWQSADLCERLQKIYPAAETYYLMGRIAMLKDDAYTATVQFNEAARKVYENWQNGQAIPLSAFVIYRDLSAALMEYRDFQSGMIIWQRAQLIFPSDSVCDPYTAYLYQIYEYNYSVSDSLRMMLLQAIDSAAVTCSSSSLTDLTFDILLNAYETDQEETDPTYDLTSEWISERYPELVNRILENWYAYLKDYTAFSSGNSMIWLNGSQGLAAKLISLKTVSALSPTDSLQPEAMLERWRQENNLIAAAKLYYCFDQEGYTGTLWKQQASLLAADLSRAIEENGYDREIYLARLALPADSRQEKVIYTAALKQIEVLITKGRFSEAGSWIRAELQKKPGDKALLSLYKQWVIADYTNNYLGSYIPYTSYNWTGSTATCTVGKIDEAVHDRVLTVLNYVRRLAAVPDSCIWSAEWNNKCQATALMMDAANDLSHFPGTDWPCYQAEGAEGARNSNLSWGYGGIAALMGQVEDDGGGNEAVGHRRWILHPVRRVYGMGTTRNAMALWTLGGRDANFSNEVWEQYENQFVAWPPAYYVPMEFICQRWSFSLINADFEQANVEVYQGKNKLPLTLLPLEYGYGSSTMVWEMNDLPYREPFELAYTVKISGVQTEAGVRNFSYPVIFLPIEQ